MASGVPALQCWWDGPLGERVDGGGVLPDLSESSTAIYTEGISPLDTWRSGSSEPHSPGDWQDHTGKHSTRRSLQGALDGTANDPGHGPRPAPHAEGIGVHGQKEARSAHIGGSLAHVGTESPLVHARAMSVSLSPEDSPAMRAGPRAPTPLSPFSPVTCTDIMRPSLRDAQGASPTAYGHGGVLVRAHASSRSPSPNESNFHSPDTLFYRYSPAAEMPPPHLSDRTEVSPSSATGGIRPPAPHFSSHKDPDASTFSLDSPISVGSQRNSHEGLSGTTVGTLHVEIVQCRNLPQTFGAHPCVYCCASLHESGQWGNVHVLSQLDKPVSETRVHPLSLTAHLLCPQHTTQSAGVSQDLEFRDSFTLDRAYALGPFRAQGDGSLVGGPMPVLASLNHRTVDLLITLHDTASQRKEIMSMAALKVKQGAAVDQWFNLFDHDGHRQTDVHGGSSAIRVSVYFAEQGIFRGSTSPLLLQDVSPPRDARRVHVHGASSVGTARANDAAQPVDVQEISLQPPPARTPSASADSRRLVEIVIGIQAKMRRTMVSRWYSAMLIRFSKVITNMPRIEVQSEVRKPPTALPGGYTELPSLVESPDLPPAGRAHMPTAFEPEPVHSIRPREPRVVQMRIMDKQPQQNGNHYVPENTSDDAVNAHSGINLPHGNMHKSPTSDTSSRLLTRQHKRSVSPASSSGPWNDRKFIEAEAFAKLARRLKESGYQEQAQMYCGEAWNLLQQLKADEDVGGQYNCVALILNEVERDMSLYTSNASFGSSLNYSLNLDPYSSTLTGPAARKTNVADAGPYKAANASSPDAGLTSAITPQPAKKFEERRRRESEVRDSWNRMGKAMENISDALENYAKQTATQQAATPMDAFKSVRKLPAAEAAALMRQRLGEPVWSPVPSTDSALQLTVAGDIGAAPSNSRSKLMELEETVRLQMRSGQRMSKRQVFEDAANLRRYGDRSASKWGPSDQTQSTTAPHSDDDILSSTSADDNVATLGSHVTPSHDLEVGRGGRGNKDSGNGDHNGVQRVISYGRSPALDELIRACDEDPALQEIRPDSLTLRARPLRRERARLRASPEATKTGKPSSPPAPPPRDPKCYAVAVDKHRANNAAGRGPGLRLSLIGNEAIQPCHDRNKETQEEDSRSRALPSPRTPTFGARSTMTATQHLLEWTREERMQTLKKRLRVLAKTAKETVAAADADEQSIMA